MSVRVRVGFWLCVMAASLTPLFVRWPVWTAIPCGIIAGFTLGHIQSLLEASNASAAQRPPDSSVAETPEEEH